MESMEGSGAAHLALHYNIPFLEIRSASNMVGKRDPGAWNLALAFERGAMAAFAFVHSIRQIPSNKRGGREADGVCKLVTGRGV